MSRCRFRMFSTRYGLLAALLVLAAYCAQPSVYGQTATATLSGTVEDQNGAIVPGATVFAVNTATTLQRQSTTTSSGVYTIPLLPPGTYVVRVEAQGFTTLEIRDVVLNVADQKALLIQLNPGGVSATVDVKSEAPLINESPAVATTVDREFVANLPLNGRSFQSLITLSPGIVLTKATGANPGQFSVNGQRPDSNYFTVDGVSANFGVTPDAVVGQTGAGSIPGLSVSGGTNNLVSVDALQEFKVLTSTYAPEYGRMPGGQISIVTRSGTNSLHGTIFDYLRNDALDANDWFANVNQLKKPALRQNDFGGVVGGPLFLPRFGEGGRAVYSGRNKTFFFFSYEGLRLRQPLTAISQVPSLASRQNAIASIRPFLNAFPLPNGANTSAGMAFFSASYSNPTRLDATSIRLDHTVNSKLSLFGRYNYAPSDTTPRGLNGGVLSQVSPTIVKTRTLTLGGIYSISPRVINDMRANWSSNRGREINGLDGFGGAIPISDEQYFPSTFIGERNFTFSLTSATYQKGGFANNVQTQFNFTDGLSIAAGNHQWKFGADFRRATIEFRPLRINGQAVFQGAAGALNGLVLRGVI
ncbi:MAG: carboxypeptidase regulatory-like domain-containing protein, partial [Pyrinomonadaceae bacterium]